MVRQKNSQNKPSLTRNTPDQTTKNCHVATSIPTIWRAVRYLDKSLNLMCQAHAPVVHGVDTTGLRSANGLPEVQLLSQNWAQTCGNNSPDPDTPSLIGYWLECGTSSQQQPLTNVLGNISGGVTLS